MAKIAKNKQLQFVWVFYIVIFSLWQKKMNGLGKGYVCLGAKLCFYLGVFFLSFGVIAGILLLVFGAISTATISGVSGWIAMIVFGAIFFLVSISGLICWCCICNDIIKENSPS